MLDKRVFDPLFPDRAWTVCFYSYRGGVGRTTLAVNVARDFIGRRLLLDFDLEAPGVDEFECMRPRDRAQCGLVEYIQAYLEQKEDPPLKSFVYQPTEDRDLFVMRAGRRDQQYRRFLADINWGRFYKDCDGALFLDNLRVAAARELGCTTLLVDSRTGHSEIGGVCLGHLADAVVFVFRPNSAHVAGLAQAAGAVRAREQREERRFPRLYIASPMPMYKDRSPPQPYSKSVLLAQRTIQVCESESVEILDLASAMSSAGGTSPGAETAAPEAGASHNHTAIIENAALCGHPAVSTFRGPVVIKRVVPWHYIPMIHRRGPEKPDSFLRPSKRRVFTPSVLVSNLLMEALRSRPRVDSQSTAGEAAASGNAANTIAAAEETPVTAGAGPTECSNVASGAAGMSHPNRQADDRLLEKMLGEIDPIIVPIVEWIAAARDWF